MKVDPAASMRVWAVEVELGGRTFEVPALPASDWFPVLVEGDPLQVLDLITSNSDVIDDLILSGVVGADEIAEVLVAAIEEVAGRSFNATLVLAMFANLQWPTIGGEMALRGFRWDTMPIGAALDAIYAVVVERLKPESLTQFHALLDTPAAHVGGKRSKIDRARAMSDFEALAGPKPESGKSISVPSGSEHPKTPPRSRQLRPVEP